MWLAPPVDTFVAWRQDKSENPDSKALTGDPDE